MNELAKREKDTRLQELFARGAKVYSISKINTIAECLYEAYNAYILHNKGQNGIYGILGTKIHDKLEQIINNEASALELPETLNQELLDLDMLGITFPKDFKGNDSIRDNWVADMKHFCKTFVPPKGTFDTEELFIYPLSNDRYVQGYIDLIRHNADGTISIYDWKTSSKFSADDLLHHGRQLVLYAIAKEAQGEIVRDVSWIMLKYCKVTFLGKKRSNSKELTQIEKIVNRGKLVQELRNNLEYDLSAAGYDEIDAECMLTHALQENSLDSLPEQIRANYKITPYVQQYPITEELKKECLSYINQYAELFETLDSSSDTQYPPRSFVRVSSRGKESEDIFFCTTLCNYRNSCKYIQDYKAKKAVETNKEDWEENLF